MATDGNVPYRRRQALNRQQPHWEQCFDRRPDMFGTAPSEPAVRTARLLAQEGATNLLELGSGQGRDTLFFAERGLSVRAVDYTTSGLEAIQRKAGASGLTELVSTTHHDVRQALPFATNSFDACYSHMLYCMALTETELHALCREIRRVLRPGGLNIYTVRTTEDPDYRLGNHHGDDLYEDEGFIVHFFDRDRVYRLAEGFEVLEIYEFQEGGLPRRLYQVTERVCGKRPGREEVS